MSLIVRMRRQYAVFWPRLVEASPDGKPQYGAPYEIRCRWEDKRQSFITAAGTEEVSNAVVYVDRPMVVGDRLWLGRLGEVTLPASPEKIEGCYEVRQFESVPNLKATEFLRYVML